MQNQILDQLHDVGYVMCNVKRYFKDFKIIFICLNKIGYFSMYQ